MHNAVFIYLFIIFRIIPFSEWYKVWVLHLCLVKVFIRLIVEPTCEIRESFGIFAPRILQPRVNDPLFSYYFKTLKYSY